jgi:hypothetical protein
MILVAATLAVSAIGPATAAATTGKEPAGIDAFLRALGQFESGGRYDARNPVSGAYGKYQIMPFNWPAWAKLYLGNADAPQTPVNQERVARAKVIALHAWLGSWPRVANWWLNGDANPSSGWTAFTFSYVNRILAMAGLPTVSSGSGDGSGAPKPPSAMPPAPRPPMRLSEQHKAISYSGSWGKASHPSYQGGRVSWASAKGASATVRFKGSSVTWIGPVGPTRGSAEVWVDGKLVTTVSEYAPAYTARRTLFTWSFGSTGVHEVRIVAAGTSGHPMVAIDEFVIGR